MGFLQSEEGGAPGCKHSSFAGAAGPGHEPKPADIPGPRCRCDPGEAWCMETHLCLKHLLNKVLKINVACRWRPAPALCWPWWVKKTQLTTSLAASSCSDSSTSQRWRGGGPVCCAALHPPEGSVSVVDNVTFNGVETKAYCCVPNHSLFRIPSSINRKQDIAYT